MPPPPKKKRGRPIKEKTATLRQAKLGAVNAIRQVEIESQTTKAKVQPNQPQPSAAAKVYHKKRDIPYSTIAEMFSDYFRIIEKLNYSSYIGIPAKFITRDEVLQCKVCYESGKALYSYFVSHEVYSYSDHVKKKHAVNKVSNGEPVAATAVQLHPSKLCELAPARRALDQK